MAARDQRNLPGAISRRILRALRGRKPLWKFLGAFCRAVEQAGGRCYLVGGFVRDLGEGRPGRDIDLMVSGIGFDGLGRILRSFPRKALGILRVVPAGMAFPVYKIRAAWTEEEIDAAPARKALAASRSRRGQAGLVSDPDAREDASHRDFTINSLLFALRTRGNGTTGEIVDFFGGLADLRRKLLRGVGTPEERFREDPLRMLRAIRLKHERGASVEKKTWAAIRRMAREHFPSIPAERVAGELIRSLSSSSSGTVRDLHRAGILRALLPEAYLSGRPLGRIRLRYAELERSLGRPLPEVLLLANLLLDAAAEEREARMRGVSRPRYRGRIPASQGRKGEQAFRLPRTERIARRLHFPRVRCIVRLLEDLGRLERVRSLEHPHARIESIFGRWKDPVPLLSLYDASKKAAGKKGIEFRPFLEDAARTERLLSGEDLVRLRVPASPRMKWILDEVREATLEGRIETRADAMELARRLARARTSEPALRRAFTRRAGRRGRPEGGPRGTAPGE